MSFSCYGFFHDKPRESIHAAVYGKQIVQDGAEKEHIAWRGEMALAEFHADLSAAHDMARDQPIRCCDLQILNSVDPFKISGDLGPVPAFWKNVKAEKFLDIALTGDGQIIEGQMG